MMRELLRSPHRIRTDVLKLVCTILTGALLIGSAASQTISSPDALSTRLVRRELQRATLSIGEREVVHVLTELPSGAESGWHTHPGEEIGYVEAGDIEMRVAGREILALRTGDAFLIPPDTPHNAREVGPTPGRMVSVYIVKSRRPLSTLVDAQN